MRSDILSTGSAKSLGIAGRGRLGHQRRALLPLVARIIPLLLLVTLPQSAKSQPQQVHPNPDCQFFFTLSATGSLPTGNGFDNRQQGCTTWSISYVNTGYAGLTVTLQSAANSNGSAGSFSAGFPIQQTSLSGSNAMTSTTGGFWWVQGTNAFVRANLSGLTGTGTVQGAVFGWRIPGAGGGGGAGAITCLTGDVAAGSGSGCTSATVQGIETVPFCTGYTPTNGQFVEYTTASSPNPCYTAAPAGGGNAASVVTYSPAASVTLTCPSATQGTVTVFDPASTALSANMTVSFASCTAGQAIILRVIQASSGGPYTVAGLPSGSSQPSPFAAATTEYVLQATGATSVAFVNEAANSGPGTATEIAAPGTAPPTGFGYLWADSTNHVFTFENPTGTVSNTAIPQTCTNQVFTAMSAAGAFQCSTVTNAMLSSASITINSTTCTLGSSCTPSAAPSGSAGGDLSGSYPSPNVAHLTHVTDASLANSGLANPATIVNGATCTLGSSCTPSTATINASSPSLDLICAHGNDTTVAVLTITGATNAAPPVFTVSTSPLTAGYLVGQSFTVAGVTPSAFNGTYTVGALSGTTITGSGSAPGSGYTSGGTAYMPCNNSSDAVANTNFSTTNAIPGGTFGSNTTVHADVIVASWSANSGNSGIVYPEISYGSTALLTAAGIGANTAPFALPANSTGGYVTQSVSLVAQYLIASPAAGTLYTGIAGSQTVNNWNGLVPVVTSTSSNQNLAYGITFAKQGLASGTYTSGITAVGSTGQTCGLTGFTSITGATATVALTGTNTIAGGTALVITNTGQAAAGVSAPTTASVSNGTATCSGASAVFSTALGGAQGMAMRLLFFRLWR